jgi:hypothetical protein
MQKIIKSTKYIIDLKLNWSETYTASNSQEWLQQEMLHQTKAAEEFSKKN